MILRSYYLKSNKEFTLAIPKKSKFLDIGQVGEYPELIFAVEPEGIAELRSFIIVNYTKPTVPENAIYLGKYLSGNKYNLVFEVTHG